MKVVILCGGRGVRLGKQENFIPKAMVKLGHKPIVWHVMKRYALAGYNDFVLALGTNGELIRDYFTRYNIYSNDFTVSLGTGKIEELTSHQETDWKVTLVDTGDLAMSGARLARCKDYIGNHDFLLTYTDCLTNLDIKKLVAFHKKSKKVATITGVVPPPREGEFVAKGQLAVDFYDVNLTKKESLRHYINGGYMAFTPKIFRYLTPFNECKLETEIFTRLIKEKQFSVYPHHGFWQWLDTERDFIYLSELIDKNKLYWLYE